MENDTNRQGLAVWRLIVLVVLVALVSAPGGAQSEETGDVDEIVVTSTRLASPIRDAARSVSVITREQIQNGRQLLGLDESLAAVPGLYMQNRFNFAQDLRISLRGFGARSSFGIRGIRLIVDEIPESLPDGQAQVDNIDLASAQRIEVLRGPAASLYGNASGGVISIYSELGADSPYGEAAFAAGDFGFRQYRLKTAGSGKSLDYLLSASRTALDGYREGSHFRGTSVNGRLAYRLGEHDELRISLSGADQPRADDPGGIDLQQASANPRSARAQNLQFDAGEALDQQRIGAVYSSDRFAGKLSLRNHYLWRDFTNRLPFEAGGIVDLQRHVFGVGGQYEQSGLAGDRLRLVAGFDLDRQDDDRRRFDNLQGLKGDEVFAQNEAVSSHGIFLLGEFNASPAWTYSAALRFDELEFDVTDRYMQDGDDSGRRRFDQWSPSLSARYSSRLGSWHASWSTSFETPTTTEFADPDGSGGFNRQLRPQSADNVEIGFKTSRRSLYFELVLFRIDLEDELIPFEIASSPGRTFFDNAGSSTRTGLEAALSWRGQGPWSADLSFTWSNFEFDQFVQGGVDLGGNRLPGLPEHFAYLGIAYQPSEWLTLNLDTRFSGRLFTDQENTVMVEDYTVSDLRLSYERRSGRWSTRFYVGVNNIFDAGYNSNIRINAFGGRYYEPAPARNVYAGIVLSFGS